MEATPSRAVRLLTAAQAASAIGDGSFYVTSALFLTRVVGLPDGQAGLWLSIAWMTGFALSTPLGSLADRIGLRGCAIGLSLVVAGTLALAPLVRHPIALLVVLTLYAVAQSGLIAVRQAIVAVAVPAADRVTLRARLHVAVNAGIGVGAALGGLALAVGTPTAYAVVLWADAVGFTVATGLVARMPLAVQPRQPAADPRSTGRWRGGPRRAGRGSVLRDHPYVAAAALSALLYLYMPMLSVLLPLFLVGRTQAPTWAVAAVFVLNTVGVMLLQVQAAQVVTSIPTATRAVRRGALALAASALVFGAAALPGYPAVALTLVLAGAAVQVVGEVLLGAGSWHLGFTLANPDRPGQWQGLFSSGLPLARALGPVVLSALVLRWTGPGWVVLAAVFAGAGLALRPVAGWAERRRPARTRPTQPGIPAQAPPTSPAARPAGGTVLHRRRTRCQPRPPRITNTSSAVPQHEYWSSTMWEYEYSLETDVNRDDLWHAWADMAAWPTWNAGIARIDIDGPFAVGTTFTMTPPHGEPIRMRLTEIDPGTVFTDEMDDGQTRVTTVHRLDTTPDGRTRISYRTTISGPAAEQIGPEITADFPDVVAALVQRASRRTTST